MPLLQGLCSWAANRFGALREKPHEFWRTVALTVSAASAVVAFVIALWQFQAQVNGARLQRTLDLIEKANTEVAAPLRCCSPAATDQPEQAKWAAIEERRAIFRYFPGRFKKVPEPLTETADLLDISRFPNSVPVDQRATYEKWDTARKHLNQLEIFAFAYVYGYVDRELLAAAICAPLVRSNLYFGPLINAFRGQLGLAQSWQIIPHAVKLMERDYGKECETLYAKLAK